jgi:hypothetical protein
VLKHPQHRVVAQLIRIRHNRHIDPASSTELFKNPVFLRSSVLLRHANLSFRQATFFNYIVLRYKWANRKSNNLLKFAASYLVELVYMVHETQHFSGRVIALIESHAEDLTRGTLEKIRASLRTPSYRKLSYEDLYARIFDVYRDLGHWLLDKTDTAIRSRFTDLGERRFKEGVPLSEVLWALVTTKEYLRAYVSAWAFADSAVELYRQQELDRLIAHFFDRAMCYAAEGYEKMFDQQGRSESADRERVPVRHGGGWVL